MADLKEYTPRHKCPTCPRQTINEFCYLCTRKNSKKPCQKIGCTYQTTTDFCKYHSKVTKKCAYENCSKNARQTFCHKHNPITMEKSRKKSIVHPDLEQVIPRNDDEIEVREAINDSIFMLPLTEKQQKLLQNLYNQIDDEKAKTLIMQIIDNR